MSGRFPVQYTGRSGVNKTSVREGRSNMKKNIIRTLGIMIVLLMCLTLAGCYTPPDDISDGTNNLTVGSSNLPFLTLVPTNTVAVETPKPQEGGNDGNGNVTVITIAPVQQIWGPDSTVSLNTDDGGNDAPERTPSIGGITVITEEPEETKTSKPVEITPTPTPNSIQLGWNGQEVRDLQKRLKELGFYSGSVDGDFGAATDAAVKAFQKANGLAADGKAGKKTLEKMNSAGAVTAKQAAEGNNGTGTVNNKPTATPKPRATATPNLSRDYYLRLGNSGSKVTTMQKRLIELGWLGGKADGEFGTATETALKAFQKKAGVWDDGVAGPDTLKLLYSNNAPRSSSTKASIGETLEKGSEGSEVRSLQTRLKKLGYLSGSVDGSYGVSTEAAVIAFQRNNGLKADGKAGTSTLNKLYSDDAVNAKGSPINTGNGNGNTDTSQVSSTGYTTLTEGDKGSAVKKLQQRLKDRGYYNGSVDGSFGSGTTAAVMAFQQQNNLRVDGKAGPATQRALYQSNGSGVTYATLREGDTGSAVKNLQYTLYELGYYDSSVDGKYGTTTADAVRAFQIRNKLSPVDGVAGNKTLQKLYSSDAVSATARTNDYAKLKKGDKGDDVVLMQDCLEQQGYLAKVTGEFDNATVKAVKKFQSDHGLKATGEADQATLVLLYGN